MPIDKNQVLAFIATKKSLITREQEVPHDYQSLKTLCLQLELEREIATLESMVERSDFEALFKARCRLRAAGNKDTCFSFTTMPESMVNELYWDIAMLFQPRTMGEMFQILMPEVTTGSKPHFELPRDTASSTPVSINDLNVRIEKVTLGGSSTIDVLGEPPSLTRLGDLVISDEYVLDVKDIAGLTFALHCRLHAALTAFNLALARRLYQHNSDLRKLADRVSMLQGQGQTPLEAITHLIRDLRLSGTRMTGATYAAPEAVVAFSGFLRYLERLPAPMQVQLKALTDGTTTLQKVITHLERGNCVEIAAANLQRIIDNPANRTFLTARPSLTNDYLKSIAKEYKKPLLTGAKDSTAALPHWLLEIILPRIEVTNSYDFISLLLAFPPEFYSSLMEHANISTNLSLELAARIKEGVLSSEQKMAFFSALFNHYQKFSLLAVMLFHAEAGEPADKRLLFFRNLPRAAQRAALTEKNTDNETLLHAFASDLDFLRFALGLYLEEERLQAIQQKARGASVVHYAVKNPESITYLFSFIPESKKLSLIQQKTDSGNTLLGLALPYPDSFLIIFAQLPAVAAPILGFIPSASPRFHALMQRDAKGNTILHRAVSNPTLLRAILELLHDHQLLATEQQNDAGQTVLFSAVPYLDSFIMLFNQFPDRRRLELARDHFLLSVAASSPQCLRFLLELSPEAERFNLLSRRTENGYTPIFTRLADNSEDILAILRLLPERDRPMFLKLSYGDHSLLYRLIKELTSLEPLLSLISKKVLLTLINRPGKSGATELHRAAHYPEILEKMLALYDSGTARLEAIKKKDSSGNRVLDWAARNPTTLGRILDLYLVGEQFSVVTEFIQGQTLITKVSPDPELLQIILARISVTLRYEAIKKSGIHHTVLRSALRNEESLRIIFSLYPKELRFQAARELAKEATSSGTLNAFLNLLVESDRLRVVKEGKLLHSLNGHAELVPIILAIYPNEEERLAALKTRDANHYTVLYNAKYHEQTFQALLSAYPARERFNALKEEVNGHTIIHHLWCEKPLIKAIMPLLSPVERLQYATTLAQIKYEKWYNGGELRGDAGFFSSFRHSTYGQAQAKNLVRQITSMTEEAAIIQHLQHFLEERATRYNQHSFAAFLLDELDVLGAPWNGLSSGSGAFNHYTREAVIAHLRARLDTVSPSL
jgi:ankyrin repeat protein